MPDFESKKQSFTKRLDQLQNRSAPTEFSAADEQDFSLRLGDWETRLDKRVEEHRRKISDSGKLQQGSNSTLSLISAHKDKALENWLLEIDKMFLEELEFLKFSLPAGFSQPARIIFNAEEMQKIIRRGCNLQEKASLEGIEPHRLAVFHIPGEATWVNFAYYTQKYGLENFNNATPAQQANLISEIAWERWGWGFFLETTTLGKASGKQGLWPALCAQRSRLQHPDAHLARTAALLRKNWALSEAGWQDWVWQYVLFKSRRAIGQNLVQRPRPGRQVELLKRVIGLFPFYVAPYGVKLHLFNLVDLFKFLFLVEKDIVPQTTLSVLLAAQEFCAKNDKKVREQTGISLSQMLGRAYFARMEAALGILCTPYALLISMHLPFEDITESALADSFTDPHSHPDTRLALLSGLDAVVKYDPKSMYTAAWERLKMEGPREFFK